MPAKKQRMPPSASITNAIEQLLPKDNPNKKRIWLDSCPEEIRAGVVEVKQRFKAGKYPNSRCAIARVIVQTVSPHIAFKPSTLAVERWLAK
jgi:hypothetical protein